MIVKSLVKKGEYHDSVTLMRVAKELAEQAEVADSAVVMGTPENLKLLESSGLRTPEMAGAGETDLLIVVKAPTEARAQALLESASGGLRKKTKAGAKGDGYRPKSLESALEALPEARLALISIAGRYAGDEAMKALERGLHVMLFSDNIPLEKEIELKTFAAARGLFVMGPDAGTAIINGVPLAFANQVARGPVGIVAASGTGLQEVTTLISNAGSGVSQAIGTGGRDVKKEVGGIMFLQGMRALLDDPQTQVLLLISKPPHESVLEKIRALARTASKPIVATFLGAEPA
ncbi:MAG: FdrA family protein, partial [Oligoflexia bacterium]|nr:FdrA family protein [Oligoflexia bacterium]